VDASVLDVTSTEEPVELSTSVDALEACDDAVEAVTPQAAPPDSSETTTADRTLTRRCLPSMRNLSW
jgi:hypothetical protein